MRLTIKRFCCSLAIYHLLLNIKYIIKVNKLYIIKYNLPKFFKSSCQVWMISWMPGHSCTPMTLTRNIFTPLPAKIILASIDVDQRYLIEHVLYLTIIDHWLFILNILFVWNPKSLKIKKIMERFYVSRYDNRHAPTLPLAWPTASWKLSPLNVSTHFRERRSSAMHWISSAYLYKENKTLKYFNKISFSRQFYIYRSS